MLRVCIGFQHLRAPDTSKQIRARARESVTEDPCGSGSGYAVAKQCCGSETLWIRPAKSFGSGPERVCTVLFFGAEIQPKRLVFCYLGFLPGFSLVFCCLPHPMHSNFQENQAFLFWRIFSLVFLNLSNCLIFLELFTC